MEIVKFKKKKANIYEIMLSDNTSLSFYDDTIFKYNLLINKKLDDKLFKEILMYNNSINAYYMALSYIKKKLRTEKEIESYLKKKEVSSKDIKNTVVRLKKEGYLNDEVYIQAYVNDQVNLTSKGPLKIINELDRLGFDSEQIRRYLDTISDDEWKEKINKIVKKKINSNHNLTKQMLFLKVKNELVNLGYELEMINSVINNWDIEEDEEIVKRIGEKEYKRLSKKYQGDKLLFYLKSKLYQKGIDGCKIEEIIEKLN